MDILRHCVGTTLVEERAMQFIARKCMQEGGDARKTLDMARAVVERCLDRVDRDAVSSSGPLVLMKDVVAQNHAQARVVTERIEGLPQVHKFCLLVLSTLGKFQVTETTLAKLKSFVLRVAEEDDLIQNDDFIGVLETLHDNGLLRLDQAQLSGLSMHQQMHVGIRLGYQLEDVQLALDKVCKGDVYERVVMAVEANRNEL